MSAEAHQCSRRISIAEWTVLSLCRMHGLPDGREIDHTHVTLKFRSAVAIGALYCAGTEVAQRQPMCMAKVDGVGWGENGASSKMSMAVAECVDGVGADELMGSGLGWTAIGNAESRASMTPGPAQGATMGTPCALR
jgi:hypothetical protein